MGIERVNSYKLMVSFSGEGGEGVGKSGTIQFGGKD